MIVILRVQIILDVGVQYSIVIVIFIYYLSCLSLQEVPLCPPERNGQRGCRHYYLFNSTSTFKFNLSDIVLPLEALCFIPFSLEFV